jgi:cytochrome b
MALRNRNVALKLPMRVWDAPIRLYHWAVLVLLVVAYASLRAGDIRLHLLSGYGVLVLVLFRILWGFVGSDTARFARFLAGPAAVLRSVAGFGRGMADTQVGHSPAGGWLAVILLAATLLVAGSGLFVVGGGFAGPLAVRIGADRAAWILALHGWSFTVLLALIVLHVLVVIGFALVPRHDLLRPMLTGKKRLPAATPATRMANPLLALLVLAVVAAGVWAIATLS